MAQLPFLNGVLNAINRANINSMFTELYAAMTSAFSGLSQKTAAQGTWNLTTNVATAPDGVTTFTPTSGVYPTSGANFLLCTGTGTRTLDGVAYVPNDQAVMNPALGQWVHISGSTGVIATTTKLLKGGGDGSAVAASAGIDYGAPIVLSCGVPIMLMPAGTVGSNGALTVTGAAFVRTYSDGIWGLYPANALASGSAAGFYWTVMSSTTVGTVYNTTYTPGGSFAIPASPTAFSGTTGAAYTNTTGADVVLLQKDFGSSPLGQNGVLKHDGVFLCNTGSTAHNMRTKWNGNFLGLLSSAAGSSTQTDFTQTVRNGGRLDRQICPNGGVGDIYQGSSGPPARSSVDTSGSSNVWTVTASLGATADWVAIESYGVVVSLAP